MKELINIKDKNGVIRGVLTQPYFKKIREDGLPGKWVVIHKKNCFEISKQFYVVQDNFGLYFQKGDILSL